MKTQTYGREAIDLFRKKTKRNHKILTARMEGMFWAGKKVGCSFLLWTLGLAFGGFTLCPTEDSTWLWSTHFFGLSSKFGHSIPQPLNLDGRSVKWPYVIQLASMSHHSLFLKGGQQHGELGGRPHQAFLCSKSHYNNCHQVILF
jgi:hypothetical protein